MPLNKFRKATIQEIIRTEIVKNSRIIHTVVTMILIQSIQFIGYLKYSNGLDLYCKQNLKMEFNNNIH